MLNKKNFRAEFYDFLVQSRTINCLEKGDILSIYSIYVIRDFFKVI